MAERSTSTSRIRPPLVELILARYREFGREPGALFWTFGFPLLLIVALGIAFRTQGNPKVTIAVIAGPQAAALVEVLAHEPSVVAELHTGAEAEQLLHQGKVALVIAPGATAGGPLTYRFDPSRPEAQATRLAVDAAIQRAAGRREARPVTDEKVEAPGARYIDWLVPGLLGLQLMSGSLWGISFVIVQARQRKLLKRLVGTPMRKRDYLLSFVLSRLTFLLVEVPVVLGFAYLAFGVEIHGSLLALLFVSILGATSFAGLGLLCGARAQNTETVNGLVNLATLPMFVLSGVFFASTRFPAFIQPVIRFLPLTALNEALRAIINDGQSITHLPFQLAILVVWTVATFAIALKLFRWT